MLSASIPLNTWHLPSQAWPAAGVHRPCSDHMGAVLTQECKERNRRRRRKRKKRRKRRKNKKKKGGREGRKNKQRRGEELRERDEKYGSSHSVISQEQFLYFACQGIRARVRAWSLGREVLIMGSMWLDPNL